LLVKDRASASCLLKAADQIQPKKSSENKLTNGNAPQAGRHKR